jgi:16S rRNA G966 N2-methylase RsmD
LFAHGDRSDAAPPPDEPAVLIFLDPPYRFLREQPERLATLAERFTRHLAPDGFVVFRHDANARLALRALDVADTRSYGGMTIEFLRVGRGP